MHIFIGEFTRKEHLSFIKAQLPGKERLIKWILCYGKEKQRFLGIFKDLRYLILYLGCFRERVWKNSSAEIGFKEPHPSSPTFPFVFCSSSSLHFSYPFPTSPLSSLSLCLSKIACQYIGDTVYSGVRVIFTSLVQIRF